MRNSGERTPLACTVPAACRTAAEVCEFAVGYFDDIEVCNVESFRPAAESSTRAACAPQSARSRISHVFVVRYCDIIRAMEPMGSTT